MTRFEGEPAPAPGFAPPVDIGELPQTRRDSSWPKVIGIIAIVLGSLAAVGGLCGALMPLGMQQAAPFVPKEVTEQVKATWAEPGLMILGALLGMGLGIVLLFVGIGLVKRRRWSVKAAQVWAPLKIVYAVANAWIGYLAQEPMREAMQNDPNMAAMPAGFTEMMTTVGLGVGVLWQWALPVFLLIWFARGKIKAEVAEWS